MKYCSNCGNELREGDAVCTKCGQPVKEKKPVNKKPKVYIISAAITAVLLVIAFIVFNQILSPEKQLNSIKQAVENEDTSSLIENVDNSISETDAAAYFKYINETLGKTSYSENIDRISNSNLNESTYDFINDGMYNLLEIAENGKQYLLFKNYDITITKQAVYNYDDYNIDEFTYEYNGENKRWNGTSDKVIDLIPGIYEFVGVTKKNDTEFEGHMTVDFSNTNISLFNPGYYYIDLTENISYSIPDVSFDDININVNGERADTDFSKYSTLIGPFKRNEEVSIETIVTIGGQNLSSQPDVVKADNENLNIEFTNSGVIEPIVHFELSHDEDELTRVSNQVMDEEMAESARKDFEANMESNAKGFVENYIYSLEAMYLFGDINEIEDYVEEGSGVYNSLVNNINSGTFEGMLIYDVSVTNYKRDGNIITLTANSERDYDALSEITAFTTVYTIEYDPEELTFKIIDFRDI